MKPPLKTSPFDWASFLLLNVIALVGAWTLAATEWDEHLSIMALIALLGVWTGTALARSRFPSFVAGLFATAYGLFVVGWQLGTTLDPALTLRRKILSILGRFAVFLSVLIAGEPNQDPLMFVLIMALLFWFISFYSAWSVMRKGGIWGAILPGGITIFIISYFYLGEVRIGLFLAIYILLLLLLAIRVDLSNRQKVWESARARVPIDTAYRVSIAGLVAAVLLVGLAWGAPAFARSETLADAWKTISDPFLDARDRVGDAFGTVRGPTIVYMSDYDEVLELKAGTQPVNRLVMDVDPIEFPSRVGRFYWRTRVYEAYEGRQWTVSEGVPIPFDPNEGDLSLGDLAGRDVVEVNFALKGGDIQLLFLPSQPIWVERTSTVTVVPLEEEAFDLLTAKSNRVIRDGESYLARGSVATPSADLLRLAGELYPQWVIERYLQLPDTITDRTIELAQIITQDLENPYDQAVAITRWLRSNIEYNRETEPPPEDVEAIDWFLFDYQIGFCNYYASAEVIMLRSLGIPARLAAGYARGTFDSDTGVYHVYSEDAHSWPEVYFPGIGWVEFEPTSSQPVLTRPEALDDEADGGPLSNLDREGSLDREERLRDLLDPDMDVGGAGAEQGGWSLLRRIALLVGGVFVGALIWLRLSPTAWVVARASLFRGITRLGVTPPEALHPTDYYWDTFTGRIYASWTEWLKRLGMITGRSQTAMERVAVFSSSLPESADAARTIVEAYSKERFGQQSIDEDEVKGAWRSLRGGLWLALLWNLTDRWRDKS
jgi:transglutaminase-like putative cysteine protease